MSKKLIAAVNDNDLVKVDELISQGEDVNYYDQTDNGNKFMPLKCAINQRNLEMMRYLISHGANLSECAMHDYICKSPLEIALGNTRIDEHCENRLKTLLLMIGLLFKSGAKITQSQLSDFYFIKNSSVINAYYTEILLTGNINFLDGFPPYQDNIPFPSPAEVKDYLSNAPRELKNIQLLAIHNLLGALITEKKISEEIAKCYMEEFDTENKSYHKNYNNFFIDYNNIDQTEKAKVDIQYMDMTDKTTPLENKINDLEVAIKNQNEKMDILIQQNNALQMSLNRFISLTKTNSAEETVNSPSSPSLGFFRNT